MKSFLKSLWGLLSLTLLGMALGSPIMFIVGLLLMIMDLDALFLYAVAVYALVVFSIVLYRFFFAKDGDKEK